MHCSSHPQAHLAKHNHRGTYSPPSQAGVGRMQLYPASVGSLLGGFSEWQTFNRLGRRVKGRGQFLGTVPELAGESCLS